MAQIGRITTSQQYYEKQTSDTARMYDIAATDYPLCPTAMIVIVLPRSHKMGTAVSFGLPRSQFDCTCQTSGQTIPA